ncbi:TonB-dependent receptor [Flavobacterium cellulosilyticum]|uniref:TonB-dependent receptor n=1 Tax=Flavobacterium cellulosilyticum TaxID=2541731 RepID=A0A4R5CNZ5_9FLAO|nr:TonB-dependent receptor [Flavobacterium cellulosilyticum]TDD99282.1 TonB-dependent receptor [Flavobacterium cellulosilyticum]
MKIRLFILALFINAICFSQNKGTITGTLTDKDAKNETLPFANVVIKGTKINTITDINGKYTLNADAGNYTIQFSFVGYDPLETLITVVEGKTLIVDKALGSGGYKLEDVIIKTNVNRSIETALLLEQRNAVEIKQAIGAQELSRKGVGDAAGAVAKTSGVSEQEGVKNVNVRGLGDRYNSTSLNGLPLPSEDPEYKNIALKFFSTNIIKNINVNKTFNASLYGDVAGANIDIASKELETQSVLNISVGSGYNSNTLNSIFKAPDGHSYFGFVGDKKNVPITDLNFYSFKTSFKPQSIKSTVNSNFSVAVGNKFNFENYKSLSFFAVLFSTSEFSFKEGKTGNINANGGIGQDLKYKKYNYNSTQSGLANVKYKFGSGKSISYNGLFIHDSNENMGDYTGFSVSINDNFDSGQKSFIRRQQTNNNILFSNQLLFDYKINEKLEANVSASYNKIDASEPDRKTNSYDYKDGNYILATNSSVLNNRYFSVLNEKDLAGKAELSYTFNPDAELIKKLNFGGNYRNTKREFDFTQINFDVPSNNVVIDINNPDAVFNQAGVNNTFKMKTARGDERVSNVFEPMYYTGKRDLYAAYAQLTYPINNKFTVQLGARYENINQKVEWDTNISSSVNTLTIDPSVIKKNYFLPSLIAKYTLSDKNAVRFAASQTYTMPQFKETAPFLYEEISFASFGNPDLKPSTNLNFDLKYDYYLSKNEIISLGGFYKKIKDPINRINVASASNELSYVNLGDAYATGFELEVRKTIFGFDDVNSSKRSNLTGGLNLSYLITNQKIIDNPNDRLTILPTHKSDKLEGASPLLINSDLSYNYKTGKSSLTSTIVLNYFYDKIYSIGTSTNENIVEKGVPTLDFVNKFEFIKNKLGINFSLKNILNPDFKLTKEYVNNGQVGQAEVGQYKKGVFTSLGIYWNL